MPTVHTVAKIDTFGPGLLFLVLVIDIPWSKEERERVMKGERSVGRSVGGGIDLGTGSSNEADERRGCRVAPSIH